MRKSALICLLTVISLSGAMAQGNIDDLLKGSLADANLLLEGYVKPAMKGLGNGLNQGWYNTAKPHKTLGVDLTMTTSLMYIPNSDKFYTVDNTKLQEVKLVNYDGTSIPATGSANVPSIFGPDKTPTYQILENGKTFNGPGGNDLKETFKITSALPVPMYQLGIGLPKNFDLKVRFAPTLRFNDFEFNLFGVGVLHDVGQYIPVVKALPVDISIFAGYTKMSAEQKVGASNSNQKGAIEFNSMTFQALVSKKISVITLYGALGYQSTNSNLAMKGTYDFDEDGQTDATDPVNLDFKNSGFRGTAGLRLKLAVFTLHADYTLAEYNVLTAGFGISVR